MLLCFSKEVPMSDQALCNEVEERINLLLTQTETTKKYLIDRVREEDWASVLNAASQLQAMCQELESVTCVSERLRDSYYE